MRFLISFKTFSNGVVIRSLFVFTLSYFEYYFPVWISAADCYLKLFDRFQFYQVYYTVSESSLNNVILRPMN